MLRITNSFSGKEATRYYGAALGQTDYYARGAGIWGGIGARHLDLSGTVSKEDFAALAQNWDPHSGTRLTVRTKDDRRAGYDFTFSVPKSVSLHLALGGNAEVERMIMESFQETMALIESTMETRVRAKGTDEDRRTGNMVYASFIHRVTRPVDGIPDPHFHIHAFVFNATFDAEENRWKAGQFGGVKTVAPYYEAVFHSLLAAKLIENGYPIRRTDRDFELLLSRSLTEKFSKRTQLINEAEERERTILEAEARALARKKGIDFGDAYEMVRAEVGARTRERKSECRLSEAELVANWRSQMTVAELAELDQLKDGVSQNLLEPETAKDLAIEHLFEGVSVVRELHAAGMFLRRGIGRVSIEEALEFANSDPRLIRAGNDLVTTREVLAEEEALLAAVQDGCGRYEEIGRGGTWTFLSPLVEAHPEQKAAVLGILDSKDLVTAIRGPAGSGKTSMMQEAVKAVAALSARDVLVFAPSSSAVKVLKEQGFAASDTFQQLIESQLLQDVARGQILWIDEAGFLSTRQMRWAVDFATENNCRLILSGDTRQHHSVDRGDALRVLEESGSVSQAALTKIFRQQVPALREAVEELSRGKTEAGFNKLDAAGVIHEVEDPDERLDAIASQHLAAIREGASSLIVAPTMLNAER